jgi:hypothetical protein
MSEQQSSADSAQPVAWRWRSIFNDSSWCYGPVMPTAHDQYVTEPLYVRTEPQAARPVDLEAIAEIVQFERAAGSGHYDTAQKLLEYFVRCQAESASVREVELEEALKNLMGIYDTPVSRRRYPQDQFMKEALDIARAALSRPQSQAVSAPLASNASDPLETLEGNCWDLRCIDIPTGGGDADIGWNIVEHHMGPPKERIVGRGRSPREALQDATSTLSRPERRERE